MKSDAELDVLPLRERVAWRIAELLAAQNAAQRATLIDALRSKS